MIFRQNKVTVTVMGTVMGTDMGMAILMKTRIIKNQLSLEFGINLEKFLIKISASNPPLQGFDFNQIIKRVNCRF
jgi:hypothetical protein